MTNIFQLPSEELFESLLANRQVLIERIISTGQTTPPGEYYNQDRDEWVILLQGEAKLSYEDNSRIKLSSGDYVFIVIKNMVKYYTTFLTLLGSSSSGTNYVSNIHI